MGTTQIKTCINCVQEETEIEGIVNVYHSYSDESQAEDTVGHSPVDGVVNVGVDDIT